MLNNAVLVGKITCIKKIEGEEKLSIINVKVPRSVKNDNLEHDYIDCIVSGSMVDNVEKYCEIGATIGVKGRLQADNEILKFIAEKVTFLSTKKVEE